jgi:site-specific recombinase XerD/ribosomal protein L40E
VARGIDVHHYARRRELAMLSLAKDTKVIPANAKRIVAFLEYAQAEGLSAPRQVRYVNVLKKFSRLLGKPFVQAKKEDIVKAISKIEKEETAFDTKRSEKECIKKFYRWLRGSEEFPREVSWIKVSRGNHQKILPDTLLTEDEVKRMAEACQNARDRCLVLVLYETGARVGEILSLEISDVQFDQYGAVLMVNGKTGARRVRIIFSSKSLTEWLNHHPARDDVHAPLWTTLEKVGSKEPLEYAALRKMLVTTARRAEISKRVNPHSFRHARASNLANALTEAQMKEYLGWVGGSKMAQVYVHLSGRNIDNALLKLNGIKTEDEVSKEEHPLKIKTCERCSESNPPTNRFCSKCGAPLDIRTALDLQHEEEKTDTIMNQLFEDVNFRSAVRMALAKQVRNAPKQVRTGV